SMMRHVLLATLIALGLSASARADFQFCNKTSYVLDLALALEEKEAAATRGWFRVDPGACKNVLQGAITADKVYVHARALAAYGPSPLPDPACGLLHLSGALRHRSRQDLPHARRPAAAARLADL